MEKSVGGQKDGAATPGRAPEGIAEVVAALLEALTTGDLIYIAKDEPRARAIALAITAGAGEAQVLFCPGSDALPGDAAPPSPANVGERTSALRHLRQATQSRRTHAVALIVTGEAVAALYPPAASFDAQPPILNVGDTLDPQAFIEQLETIGYFADERVDEPGEYAARANLIDVYPADAAMPYRIDVTDGTIAAIRTYDAGSQRTIDACDTLEVGRACEPALGPDGVTLIDHLPHATIFIEGGADDRRRTVLDLAQDAQRRKPEVARALCDDERWHEVLSVRQVATLEQDFRDAPPRFVEQRAPQRAFLRRAKDALAQGHKVLLLGSERDLRFIVPRITAKLGAPQLAGSWDEARQAPAGTLLQMRMPLPRGFHLGDIVAVTAADLLGSRAERGDEAHAVDLGPFQLGDIRSGDVVVHEDHGLCVVEGLEAQPSGGDALVLRFAGDTRRLVPTAEAGRIWRYGAEETAVTLDKLDGSSWTKRRAEMELALAETARELTRLASERQARSAPVLEPDPAAYERFAAGFPFTETADQTRAIDAVRDDLASGEPMDRLVIGDVGFGKTEVALRAAAIAALAGKQVALAVPTTVLARQHLETFTARFAGTGVNVAGLSRLTSAAEKKAVKAGLADGSIGVVIGTGAVAAKGIAYADLALVIVDEEQRFGTADKARLRALSAGHVLSMSATPIPRTLQSALVGLQQLSVIATPPARRQPIRTTVLPFDDQTARTALLRERARGGQSFVVAPRIEDLAGLAARLAKVVPELQVLQAHGKLPAAELDEIMVAFAQGEGDVLLATNIIEAGLDVPRANTMLVWRADRFGLSQLHQLRGRVGRGRRRGQVLLTTEPDAEIAKRTLARLNTLAAFDRLGAGFAISARDLDMRGAGDLIGEDQAGHMKLIGVDLYQHLLERAIAEARGAPVEDWMPTINIGQEGRLPETWVPDPDVRIGLYAALARLSDTAGLEAFEEELTDRFGELPEEAASLLYAARLRIVARASGVDRIDAGPAAIALTPRAGHEAAFDGMDLTKSDQRYLLKGDYAAMAARIETVEELLADVGG